MINAAFNKNLSEYFVVSLPSWEEVTAVAIDAIEKKIPIINAGAANSESSRKGRNVK